MILHWLRLSFLHTLNIGHEFVSMALFASVSSVNPGCGVSTDRSGQLNHAPCSPGEPSLSPRSSPTDP